MSARTKIAKSLGVGAYAPVVFQPSADGEHIKRAVTELGLTGVTICGETVTADTPKSQPKPQPKLPPEFINIQWTNGLWIIDRVTPRYIETLGSRRTQRGATTFARSRARRFGLTVYVGPYVWEAAA